MATNPKIPGVSKDTQAAIQQALNTSSPPNSIGAVSNKTTEAVKQLVGSNSATNTVPMELMDANTSLFFTETGRVFLNGENSDAWHTAAG